MKKLLCVLALVLLFAGNAVAGPNAAAVASLDLTAGNSTDDKATSGSAAGAGTDIQVEVFVAGTAGPVIGGEIVFDLDPAQIKVKAQPGGLSPATGLFALGTTDNSATIGGFPPGSALADGFFATVTFETVADVTGVEFTIKVANLVIVDGGTTTPDTLAVATVLSFNSKPKVVPEASAPVVVPRGGEATTTVSVSGFAADAPIDWTVTVDGAAKVDVIAGGAMMDGATFTTTETTLQLKASGSGSATVTLTATSGGTTTDAITVVFSEQVPAELSAFGGEMVEDRVVLNWTTASQTNNAGWRVLRSTDNETFQVVSELIPGAGTTDALLNYDFADREPPSAEKVFYILEQIDLDGTVHRSNIVEVLLGARFLDLPTEFATTVYPNPFNPSTTISYDLPSDALVTIVIYDALGQEIRHLVNEQVSAGRYSVQWDAKDALGHFVGSGVYIAKIKADVFSATQKMLLLK
jgi:hypothetical protein